MTASYPIQASFNRGEVSPLLKSRVDADLFKMALDTCENFSVLIHGGLRRRSGTRFVAEAFDSDEISRLFPFLFSNSQAYVLEVSGGGEVQFYAQRGILASGGSPYTIAHPWAATDIPALTYTQFNDLAFFAHASYAPQRLERSGDTDWSLGDAIFNDGPYLEENRTATTLTPADTGAAVPDMTNNTTPSGTAAGTGGISDAWEAFDRNPATSAAVSGSAGFVSYDFSSSDTKVVDGYWLQADAAAPEDTPSNWVFEGYDGSNWVALDTQLNQIGWVAGERRYYEFNNTVGYQSYRLSWTSVDGGSNSKIAELAMHESGDYQTPFNLTASFESGINGGQGFLPSDVGRTIRLRGADGRWRWARIDEHTSSTVVKVRLYGHALPDTAPITKWALGAFSEASGFPALVTLYNERLCWARTDAQPLLVVGSKSTDLQDYGFSVPVVATDAFNITLLSSDMTELNWLTGDEDLITGSAKQIRSIGPDDITMGFSALNLRQRKGPNSGAAPIQPLSVGGTTLYVASGARKIRELILGDQNRYVAPELSILGEHVFSTGIVAWAFSENPEPMLYVVTENGELAAMLYDREQRAVGFARFVTAGEVESLAVVPSDVDGFDDVYLVVKRTINGVLKRYVEVLERPFDYAHDDVEDAFFVDCGLSYDGSPATVISGLDHLEGEAVAVLADGAVVEGLTVDGGEVTLPYAASRVHIGLAYQSVARTLRFAGPGQDGMLFGRRVNTVTLHADLLATGALTVGAYGGRRSLPGYEVNRRMGNSVSGFGVELITGVQRCNLDGSWTSAGQIEMKTSEPLPALIRSVIMQVEHEP